MSRIRRLFGVCALMLLGSALAVPAVFAGDAPAQTVVWQLGEKASGTQVTVPVGQLFEVTLAENATTGYSWQIAAKGDPACSLLDDTSEYPGTALGSGGFRHLLFRAVQVGTGTIRLEYLRPWEKGVAPIETFTLSVRVGEGAAQGPSPMLAELSSAGGRPGNGVFVKGESFVPGASAVLFDGRPVASLFFTASQGLFQVPLDAEAGSHSVVVQTAGKQSQSLSWTVSGGGPDYAALAAEGSPMVGKGERVTLATIVSLLRTLVGLPG